MNLDIKKQAHDLCTTVYQIKGYIKGKTLLPFPEVRMDYCFTVVLILFFALKSIQTIEDEERRMRSSTDNTVDVVLKTNIEGIIVKWGVQVVKFMRVDNV